MIEDVRLTAMDTTYFAQCGRIIDAHYQRVAEGKDWRQSEFEMVRELAKLVPDPDAEPTEDCSASELSASRRSEEVYRKTASRLIRKLRKWHIAACTLALAGAVVTGAVLMVVC